MNFTTLDLPTQLQTISDAAANGFGDLDADGMARVARDTETHVKGEINRQMRTFIGEQKAYCDAVKQKIARITQVYGAAAKELKTLEKLKDKPKNARDIATRKRLIDQSYVVITEEVDEIQDLATALATAHTALRNDVMPAGLDRVLGGTKPKELDAHFKKLREPTIAWLARLKGPRETVKAMQKRVAVMQREAAVLANTASDEANVGMAVEAELDMLFAPNGPIDMLARDAHFPEQDADLNTDDVQRGLKGRNHYPSQRHLEVWKKGKKGNVRILADKQAKVKDTYDTAMAHLHAVEVLAKKAPLTDDQKQRVREAKDDLKIRAKQIKKNDTAISAFRKVVKSVDKVKMT